MQDLHCLILAHAGAHYALATEAVREIVWRPWLTPFAEMPDYVAGVFQLRGRMVPVIDLQSRLGGKALAPQTWHRIVVLERAGQWLGLLVEDVARVAALPAEALEPVPSFALPGSTARFLKAGARLPDGLVWLLDLEALISHSELPQAANPDMAADSTSDSTTAGDVADAAEALDAFAPARADIALYHQRAERLAAVPPLAGETLQQIAVLRLGDECFGLPLTCVKAFVHLRGLTPIPGAAAHIAGHMNLRGELLTVVDVRRLLGLPSHAPGREVAVVQLDGLELGLLTEAIDDIAPYQPAPATTSPKWHSTLCHAVFQHQALWVSLIDTNALRARLLEASAHAAYPTATS